jgi:hypothetical protein
MSISSNAGDLAATSVINSPNRGRKRKQILGDAATGTEVAEQIKQRRTVDNTKSNYRSKINTMIEWLKSNGPTALDEADQLIIPIHTDTCLSFFGSLCAPAQERARLTSAEEIPEGAADPYSVSVVRGFRSALVDRYTSANMILTHFQPIHFLLRREQASY